MIVCHGFRFTRCEVGREFSAAQSKIYSRNGNESVPGGIRTPNLLIRSQMLYPVELQALRHFRFQIVDFRFNNNRHPNWQSAIANQKL